jgi:hypothetical protein
MPPTNEPAGNGAAGTGDTPTPATQEPKTPPSATPETANIPEGYELIRTEDKNNIISQRDKAKNEPKSDPQTQAVLSALMQKDAVRDAMATPEFKEKYPDVTQTALLKLDPADEADIDKLAGELQADYERVKQAALKKVQVATAPTMSATDRDTKLNDLAKPAKTSRFQEALKLARTQVK